MHSKLVLAVGLIGAAMLAACSSTSPYGSVAGAPSPSASTAPVAGYPSPAGPTSNPSVSAAGTPIKVGSSRLGNILVDGNGRTLYYFLADMGTTSYCISAGCVQNWPPVLTNGAPQAGPGVSASLLGTTTRKDGTVEVTYAGHPLYYFVADRAPGQVAGQGINAFGARWYAVSPSGVRIG